LRQILSRPESRDDSQATRRITIKIEPLKDHQQADFIEAAAAVTMWTRLEAGSQVFLRHGWDYMGS
jgi:hypothetical protein